MDTLGTHLLVEFHDCNPDALNDVAGIETSMRAAASAAGATVVQSSFHKFGPHGVSGVLVLAESHLSVHTWPEHGYASADIYTCGTTCQPELAPLSLQVALAAGSLQILQVQRGIRSAEHPESMKVMSLSNLPGVLCNQGSETPKSVNRPGSGPK